MQLKYLSNMLVEQNCIFSGIVGAESLYLLLRVNYRRLLLLWALLLPLLVVYSVVDEEMRIGLNLTLAGAAYPYVVALLAAAGAGFLVFAHRLCAKESPLANGGQALLFASSTALFLSVSYQDAQNTLLSSACLTAVSVWIGYGAGVIAFWSLGRRLRANFQSPARSIALLYLVFAVVSAILAGFSGLKL
jgi:hypothetical protein